MITVVYSTVITYWIHFIHVLHDSGPTYYVPAIVLGTATFFKNFFILYWGVADQQCCDSFRWRAKGFSHTYTCIHSPLPSRLPYSIEQSSTPYIVGSGWLSIWHNCIASVLSSNNPMRRKISLSQIYPWGNWGSVRTEEFLIHKYVKWQGQNLNFSPPDSKAPPFFFVVVQAFPVLI